LIRLGVRASVIETPTSNIKLRAYGFSHEQARQRAEGAIRHATQNDMRVAFFAVDATRSELDFLRSVYEGALEAGARELVVVDTIGACGPEAVEFLVEQVRSWVGRDVPLHFHGHNDFGLGTASAIAAVRAGATWIQGTINGMGERAGNADIGEIALALQCLYGVPVELNLSKIREVSKLVQQAAGYKVEPWRPLVGENLFMRESGAVASQFQIPEAIEPFAAELVGAQRQIVLGKKSGLDSIELKCKELGVEVPEGQRAALLDAVKRKGTEKRGLVTDAEFLELVQTLRDH
jgi:isopropylmalate/homocitrate/citramalate synthase